MGPRSLSRASLLSLLNVGLSAVAVFCLLVICFEAAARLVLPDLVAASRALVVGDERILFASEGAFANRSGYFNFRPDSELREIAYYPDAAGGFSVEADCTFRSDQLGFVSNAVSYEASDTLLLGDSFAQGSGGCAWLPRLEPALRQKLYSAAVLGTGVKHWRNIVADLEKRKRPQKIVMVFITHDFFRDDWVFAGSQLACLARQKDCNGQYWYPLSANMSGEAAERYALRKPGIGRSSLGRLWGYYFPASATLFKMLKSPGRSPIFQESLEIVAELARAYPLKLIWVNQKEEVAAPEPRTVLLWEKLKGYDLTKCNIPADGFLARDGHPNAKGYDVLKGCVERVAGSW